MECITLIRAQKWLQMSNFVSKSKIFRHFWSETYGSYQLGRFFVAIKFT